jgi:hypothetical protein
MMFYTWGTKLKIGKWNYIKIKSFCMTKKKNIKVRDNLLTGRKYI